MRIIKEGKIPEAKKYTLSCAHCQTLFEIDLSEASEASEDYSYHTHSVFTIDCPLCKRSVKFDEFGATI